MGAFSRKSGIYILHMTNEIGQYTKVKSKEIAYLLGFIWADGYVSIKNKHYCTGMGIQREDFDSYIKPLLKIGNWRMLYHKQEKRKEQGRARWYCKDLALYLKSVGYCSKNENAYNILNVIPEKLVPYWFRGLFDGDGCVYVNRKKRGFGADITGPYDQQWNYVEDLYNKLKVSYSIRRTIHKTGKTSHIRIRKQSDIITFLNYIYKDFEKDGIGFQRKYDKFLEIKNHYIPPSSKYKGLSITPSQTWQVKMCQQGKYVFIGTFKTEEEAVEKYNDAVKNIIGQSGILNIWKGPTLFRDKVNACHC